MEVPVPRQPVLISRIIHVALLFSMVAYLVVVLLLTTQGQAQTPEGVGGDPEALAMMTRILVVISAIVTMVAWVLPRRLYNDDKLRKIMLAADPSVPVDQVPVAPILGRAATAAHPVHAGLIAMRVPMVIRLALLESVGIYGLILSFMSQDPNYFYWFGGVAFVMMVFAGPRPERVVEMYRRLQMEGAWQGAGVAGSE